MGVGVIIVGLALLIFNKPLSFQFYRNRSKLEGFHIWNVRKRILIMGAFLPRMELMKFTVISFSLR